MLISKPDLVKYLHGFKKLLFSKNDTFPAQESLLEKARALPHVRQAKPLRF